MRISDYLGVRRAIVGGGRLLLPGVAAIVGDAEGRVLFLRRADDARWGLPAGFVEPGETPAEAVAREVHEETGLIVRPVQVAGVFGGGRFRHRYAYGDEVEFTMIVFDFGALGRGHSAL